MGLLAAVVFNDFLLSTLIDLESPATEKALVKVGVERDQLQATLDETVASVLKTSYLLADRL